MTKASAQGDHYPYDIIAARELQPATKKPNKQKTCENQSLGGYIYLLLIISGNLP